MKIGKQKQQSGDQLNNWIAGTDYYVALPAAAPDQQVTDHRKQLDKAEFL